MPQTEKQWWLFGADISVLTGKWSRSETFFRSWLSWSAISGKKCRVDTVPAAGGSCLHILSQTASTEWWINWAPAGHRCSSASPPQLSVGRSGFVWRRRFRVGAPSRPGPPAVSVHRAQREAGLPPPGSPWCELCAWKDHWVCLNVCACVCVFSITWVLAALCQEKAGPTEFRPVFTQLCLWLASVHSLAQRHWL